MSSQFPLERICWLRSESCQLTFARRALELLPQGLDRSFEASRAGLLLRGETESTLERSLTILKDAYGELLSIGAPTIRYHHAGVLEEPHMGVRVLCPAKYFGAVKEDLLARGAILLDAELAPPTSVVRVTAPLAKLLGYAQDLATLTSGSGREVMWLSHYAPVEAPAVTRSR